MLVLVALWQLTLESDRALISELEEQMIREFGHQIVRNVLEGAPSVAHLTSKLLRDEHVPTLVVRTQGLQPRPSAAL